MRGGNSVLVAKHNKKQFYELFEKGTSPLTAAEIVGTSYSTASKYYREYKISKEEKEKPKVSNSFDKALSDEWMFWVNRIRKYAFGKEPLKLGD